MKDQFLTILEPSEGYYMDSGSKFIALAFPVNAEHEMSVILQKLKKEHPKARHFCTALRLHADAALERSNDDGEPSGSAGKPILGQLIKNDLTNIFVVVVRYFGGTKLGIPGLIEAYKTSTVDAIAKAKIVSRHVYSVVRIAYFYDDAAPFLNHIRKKRLPVFKEAFEELPFIDVGFPKSNALASIQIFLKEYTRMDFDDIDQYADYLHIRITLLPDDVIL